jgi:adenosylhomocysteine nucleosidase
MKDVLVICAMGMEARAIPAGYRVVECGPGFRAARAALDAAVAAERPRLVVSAGTCGALDPGLVIGDVRVVSRIESPLGTFEPRALAGVPAVLRSQDRVAVTARDKKKLFDDGAEIVDMEAAALAYGCEAHGIEFACIKAVSDLAGEDLPLDFNLYRDEAGQFQTARIAFAGIMKIADLMRLKRQGTLAVQQLGEAFESSVAGIA